MNYANLLGLINSLFNPAMDFTWITIPKAVMRSYYFATGIHLENCKARTCSLTNTAKNTVSKGPIVYLVKCIGMEEIPKHEILSLDGTTIFLCFIPEDIVFEDYSPSSMMRKLYDIYDYVINNTRDRNIVDQNCVYNRALKVMPMYLLITTLYLCVFNIDYSNIRKALISVGLRYELPSAEVYNQIVQTDNPVVMDYGRIASLAEIWSNRDE